MEEKILTKHPDPEKKGVNISREKYDLVRGAILRCLEAQKEASHTELTKYVRESFKGKFEGSINWYVEVVKLDLEARAEIERLESAKPQRYRVAGM
jgi:hypothetical protein